MKAWTNEHEALLSALRANDVVPELYRRLSLDRLSPDDDEVRRLRGWASSLRSDPGWHIVAPLVERPSAWPGIWQDATEAGFSAATEHHHALLFGRFTEQFIEREDYPSATWAWGQTLRAWRVVFSSDYPDALYDDLAPSLSEDGAQREDLLRDMLDRLVEARAADLRAASGVSAPGVGGLQRRPLRFAWQTLEAFGQNVTTDDAYGTLGRLDQLAREARGGVSAELLRRVEKEVEELDLSEARGESFLAPFRWVADYFGTVGFSEQASTTIVSKIVETCWSLRKLDRDETHEFRELLELGKPFNDDLFDRLMTFEAAFGHNSRCADFLVFVGELADKSDKREIFRRGLEVCPGHRNCKMLLSYQDLHDASAALAKAAVALPGFGKKHVTDAHAAVLRAEETYPYNESLDEFRERVADQAKRLKVDLD